MMVKDRLGWPWDWARSGWSGDQGAGRIVGNKQSGWWVKRCQHDGRGVTRVATLVVAKEGSGWGQ